MKESPRIKALANYGGKSIPMIPKTQTDCPKRVSFKMYNSGPKTCNFPLIVISRLGREERVAQSGWAGILPYNCFTISVGPTIALVPVSTIPLRLVLTVVFPNFTESNPIYQ